MTVVSFHPRSRNRYRTFIDGELGPMVKKAGVERLRGALMGGRKPPPPLPEVKRVQIPTFVKVQGYAEAATCPDPDCSTRNYFNEFAGTFVCKGPCGKRYDIRRDYN